MKLARVQITEFQSIRDSGVFDIGDITCLVGKNESGKTALLQALYRLNPFIDAHGGYSVTDDFPRASAEDYRIAVEEGKRPPARVVLAEFALDDEEMQSVEAIAGPGALATPTFWASKGYDNELRIECRVDEAAALRHTIARHEPLPGVAEAIGSVPTIADAIGVLVRAEQSEQVHRLIALLGKVQAHRGFGAYIAEAVLKPRLPKFLYFDEYYQLQGRANIERLSQRVAENRLERSDYPLLGLLARARLKITDLLEPGRTRELKNRLEGAGNHLTRQVIKYWSQNRHLQLRFDVRPARRDDPEGMREGTNLWSEVYDAKHMLTTELAARSRGFVWFFSFLAWYGDVQRENRNVILLLDEPGISLHAKAQQDLLRYFAAEISGHHQLIYSTHSPHMVDPRHFDRVRIVQDPGLESDEPADIAGTRVTTDLNAVAMDSLVPLQGALGTGIAATLFSAPHTLAVESVADLLFLDTMSALLIDKGRPGLSRLWSITPVGGAAKLAAFVALSAAGQLGPTPAEGQRAAGAGHNLAVLMDLHSADPQAAETLIKKALFAKNRVLTFADFTWGREASIEDMFDIDFYLRLINEEYRLIDIVPVQPLSLPAGGGILRRLEAYFAHHRLPSHQPFRRERPARYFAQNIALLGNAVSHATLARFETLFEQLNAML